MKHLNVKNLFTGLFNGFVLTLLISLTQSCSTDVGGNEDNIKPIVTIQSIEDKDDTDGEIIGTASIQWTTDEPNKSTVDIFLSSDSGTTFNTVLVLNEADDGEYSFDTNTIADCRTCRIRIIATDVVGNTGDPVTSSNDFIINNVPQVIGTALHYNTTNAIPPGLFCGDSIVIPFDKDVTIRSALARDFSLPVVGDKFGISEVSQGPNANEITITIDGAVCADVHFHLGGDFTLARTHLTAPSGVDINSSIPAGTIIALDTGLTAEPLPAGGIDIAPTFGNEYSSVITTADTVAVAIADINGTGELDLVTLNTGTQQDVWFNTATPGVFTSSGNASLGGLGNTSLTVGDIDGVNGLDIIVGNTSTSLVFTNDGNGTFASLAQPVSFTSTKNIQAVVLGDVDGNGSLDLVAGTTGSSQVFINDGNGIFTALAQSISFTSITNIQAVALGDVDGNGSLDLVAGINGANHVFTNNGSGVFSSTGQTLGGNNTRSVALNDIDADGDLDLVTGNDGSQANLVWLNNGKGDFTDSGQALGSSNTRSIVLLDYDRDGDADLVVGNNNQANLVWFNNGSGIFSDSGQSLSNNATESIALGDIDGDGDPDLISGNNLGLSQVDTLWLNSQRAPGQTLLLDTIQTLDNEDTRAIASGDVDGDGDIDLVTGNAASNRVLLNQAGVYSDSGQSLGSGNTFAVELVDVDGDGDLDLVAGNNGGGNSVWLNDATGVYSHSGQSLGTGNTRSVSLGDIDNDGDPDLITGNLNQANRVWRNNGSGIFSEDDIPQTLGSSPTLSVQLGDIDGDGDLDIVAGNFTQPDQVWFNSGLNSGVFIANQALNTISNNDTTSLSLADLDADGDLDLVAVNSLQGHLIWINDGSTSNIFTGPQVLANSDDSQSVTLTDLNNDGNPDLLIGYANRDNELRLNNGSGVFSTASSDPTIQSLANGGSDSLITGDIDGDGDSDVIFDNNLNNSIKIWANDF